MDYTNYYRVRLDQYYEINWGLKKLGILKKGPNLQDKPCGRKFGVGHCYLGLSISEKNHKYLFSKNLFSVTHACVKKVMRLKKHA